MLHQQANDGIAVRYTDIAHDQMIDKLRHPEKGASRCLLDLRLEHLITCFVGRAAQTHEFLAVRVASYHKGANLFFQSLEQVT